MKKVEYQDYCIAFLDILGFKNLIGSQSADVIHSVFDSIRRGRRLILESPREDAVGESTKFYLFSDTIVCAVPMEEPGALELVASHCMLLQHTLWYYGLPVWLRGGIACGALYCGESEIFGPALIEAYRMESTRARYPRVVMSEDTYRKAADGPIPFLTEEDGLRMVEIFGYFNYGEERERVVSGIRTSLQTETDPRILEKYRWLKARYQIPD